MIDKERLDLETQSIIQESLEEYRNNLVKKLNDYEIKVNDIIIEIRYAIIYDEEFRLKIEVKK